MRYNLFGCVILLSGVSFLISVSQVAARDIDTSAVRKIEQCRIMSSIPKSLQWGSSRDSQGQLYPFTPSDVKPSVISQSIDRGFDIATYVVAVDIADVGAEMTSTDALVPSRASVVPQNGKGVKAPLTYGWRFAPVRMVPQEFYKGGSSHICGFLSVLWSHSIENSNVLERIVPDASGRHGIATPTRAIAFLRGTGRAFDGQPWYQFLLDLSGRIESMYQVEYPVVVIDRLYLDDSTKVTDVMGSSTVTRSELLSAVSQRQLGVQSSVPNR